ncbi:MAG: ABC transporter permease [bacterium]|nr:ABC transporter permease [bacterium]
MRNFWLVARHEYGRTVFTRTFLIIALAVPLGIAALVGIIAFVKEGDKSDLPIGYIDQTQSFDLTLYPDDEDYIPLQAYDDKEAALAALQQEEIQALFILPANYPASMETELYYLEHPPDGDHWRDFHHFIRLNLLAAYPDEIGHRLIEGANITVHDIVNDRQFSKEGNINIVLPFIVSIIFFISTLFASGTMIDVVADEKENRTMELMLTTLSPGQFIGGKALGLFAATLTQLAIHTTILVIGLLIARPYASGIQHLVVPWGYIGVMALFFFPAYALISAIMIAIGSAVSNSQQAQQFVGILTLLFGLPLFLVIFIFENPGAPIVVFFTLFPTTAFMMISLRWGVSSVPFWQMGISWVLLVATTIFMLWAATKIFRLGMLRYGQPLNMKGILANLRGTK